MISDFKYDDICLIYDNDSQSYKIVHKYETQYETKEMFKALVKFLNFSIEEEG